MILKGIFLLIIDKIKIKIWYLRKDLKKKKFQHFKHNYFLYYSLSLCQLEIQRGRHADEYSSTYGHQSSGYVKITLYLDFHLNL